MPTLARLRRKPSSANSPRQSLSMQLTRELSAAIGAGRFKVGEKLPTEQELCESFGVSRTVVREAISSLRADGLVASHQGKGVFVLERLRAEGFQVDRGELQVVQEVIKVLELRIGVEAEAAAIAARVRTAADLKRLRGAVRAMLAATEAGRDSVEEDLEFHRAIASATGNRYFVDFFNHLGAAVIPRTRINRFRADPAGRAEYMRTVNREHVAILAAIESGDAEGARAAIRLHLGRSRDALRASIGS
jgi:DNA-binding FadR family transcriptional regulator